MSGKYSDIMALEHHQSHHRPHMSKLDRAAQFSPFAALTGYDAVIAETGRFTSQMAVLDDNFIDEINEKLCKLQNLSLPQVKITYFKPDDKKAGGAYIQVQGRLKKLDSFSGCLIMEDKTTIPINSIFAIEIEEDFKSE